MKNRLRIQAAATEGGAPRITGEAYTGGKIEQWWADYPLVVDLVGMKLPKRVPLLSAHRNDPGHRFGLVKPFKVDGQLQIDGSITSKCDEANDVVTQGQAGDHWQLSMGVVGLRQTELVAEGKKRVVNGAEHEGPFFHVKKSLLEEVSVVPVGADSNTRAMIHAMAMTGGVAMRFKAWAEKHGHDLAALGEQEINALRAEYDVAVRASQSELSAETEPELSPHVTRAPTTDPGVIAAAAVRAERDRVSGIRAACAGEFPEIEAASIASEATVDQVRTKVLEAIRAARPNVNTIIRDNTVSGDVIEAACLMSGRLPAIEKHYEPKVLDAAQRLYRGGLGLQEVLIEAARGNGYTGRPNFKSPGDLRAVMEFAFPARGIRAAGTSTIDVGGILSNIANKHLLQGFNSVERSWELIAAIRNVSDFKLHTSYRLTGDLTYEKVGPGGEIKHGKLGEQSYTNQAFTYAKMLAITRQDIINDDLGALTAAPQRLGRGGALTMNEVHWTEFMDNAAFFTSARNNYFTGATTALSIDSLTVAEQMFFDQTDPDGKPLGVLPAILLVPSALNVKASQYTRDTEIRDTTASKQYSTNNPHAGKWKPVMSAYLANATFTGNSTTAWYLLANPLDLPVIECACLNGVMTPTIEQADADFNTLGIQMRGYHDFGVKKQEYRGGVKSKGAA